MRPFSRVRATAIVTLLWAALAAGGCTGEGNCAVLGIDCEPAGGASVVRPEVSAVASFAVDKQIFLFDTMALFSADFTTKIFEAPTPSESEIDAWYASLAALGASASAAQTAAAQLQAHTDGGVPGAQPQGLFDAVSAFVAALSDTRTRGRQRIQQALDMLSPAEREAAFDAVPMAFKQQHDLSSSAHCESKLDDGQLDNEANQIFNALYYGDPAFSGAVQNGGNNIGTIVERDGSEMTSKGMEVIKEGAKAISPAFGKAEEYVGAVQDFEAKVTSAYDDPVGTLKDEVKSALTAKLQGMIDVDGPVDVATLAEDTGTAMQMLTDVVVGWGSYDAIAAQNGRAVVNVLDRSGNADVFVADRSTSPTTGEPEMVLGALTVGTGQFLLPPGTWTIWLSADECDSPSTSVTLAAGQSVNVETSASCGDSTPPTEFDTPECRAWCGCMEQEVGLGPDTTLDQCAVNCTFAANEAVYTESECIMELTDAGIACDAFCNAYP